MMATDIGGAAQERPRGFEPYRARSAWEVSLEGIEEHAAVIPAVSDTIERRDAALVTRHYRSLHFRWPAYISVASRTGLDHGKSRCCIYLKISHSTPSDENFGAALLRCRWNRKYSISCTIYPGTATMWSAEIEFPLRRFQ